MTDRESFERLADWPFGHRMRVRWAEADIQGVVFNGNYLLYFDVGITEYLRAVYDNDHQKMHAIFDDLYVVKSTLEYGASARFDEEIDIAVRTSRIGKSSLTFDFQIFRDDEPLVAGQNIYVHAPDGQSSPVPEAMRKAITRFEENNLR